MTALTVGLHRFRVQFRHLSKLTKRPTLHKAPMDVLTTCVIAMETMNAGAAWDFRGMAIGHAMCDPSDNFRKDFARDTSFRRAVADCALFRDVKDELIAEYERVKPSVKTHARSKYSAHTKVAIAEFLRNFASNAGGSPEETAAILEAARTIKSIGKVGRATLDDDSVAAKIASGAKIREQRSTPEGRAQVNAEKRARRAGTHPMTVEIPKAAG